MLLPSERIRRNYKENSERDPAAAADERGLLNGQGRPELASWRFGYARIGHSGCEAIAVYNALQLLGSPQPLAVVVRDFERGGYLRLGGYFGAVPYLTPLLRRYGLEARAVSPAHLRKWEGIGGIAPGSVYLMAVVNDRRNVTRGLHTFAAEFTGTGWEVFNRFDNDERSRTYPQLDDILRNGSTRGAFLVIYRVTRVI